MKAALAEVNQVVLALSILGALGVALQRAAMLLIAGGLTYSAADVIGLVWIIHRCHRVSSVNSGLRAALWSKKAGHRFQGGSLADAVAH